MATIITDLRAEPVRAQEKPERKEETRKKGRKPPQRRNRKPIGGGKKKQKTKSALADMRKVDHNRGAPKAGQQTEITPRARKEVYLRADGHCERCGLVVKKNTGGAVAHLNQASQLGAGWAPWNLILACRSCHNWMDGTAEGREWSIKKSQLLEPMYKVEDWIPRTHANYRPSRTK